MRNYEKILARLQKASEALLYEIRQECLNLDMLSPGATIGDRGLVIAKRVRTLMQASSALDVSIAQINKIIKADGKTSDGAVDGEKTPDNSIAGAV